MSALFARVRSTPHALAVLLALAAALLILGAGLAPGAHLGAGGGFAWQVATGLGLSATIGWQWLLLVARLTALADAVLRHHRLHRHVGAASLALFAIHALGFGYAWTSALSLVFLALGLSGLLNREVLRYRNRALHAVWLFVHVALATALVPLALVHAWVALIYE
jgi:hypothetical protein